LLENGKRIPKPIRFIALTCPIVMVTRKQQPLKRGRTTQHLNGVRVKVWLTLSGENTLTAKVPGKGQESCNK
jgi:hypothetical protein